MIDFIIVGRGLAATTLSHHFLKEGISFNVIGVDALSSCSRVAAGIWNPIVFKRLTKSWMADEIVPYLNEFYSDCETRMGADLLTQRPIFKPFSEEQEKRLWFKKASSELSQFLDANIHETIPESLQHCRISMGYAVVKNGGNLDMERYLDASADYFKESFINEVFDHSQLKFEKQGYTYKTIVAKNIVFCEGYRVKDNPYFNWIPLKPAKGEVLTIEVPELKFINTIFNKNGFLMDLSPGLFKAGATYAWDDLTEDITEAAREELKDKIAHMINCDYKLIKHQAGIRPSSIDRRPILGQHPKHEGLFVFNGLGTKGVMLAPFFAKKFVNFYLQKEDLYSEVNVKRFYHLYEKEGRN